MLEIENDPFDGLVELIEIAATWHELEYSEGEPLIDPRSWPEFAEIHSWEKPERMMDLMLSLASLAREPYRLDAEGVGEDRATAPALLASARPDHEGRHRVAPKRIQPPRTVATVTPISLSTSRENLTEHG